VISRPPLSALDLAIVSDGETSADALRYTTEMARRAERLGLRRFWVAEHHNMRTVASTTPSVLIAHVAAATERIRVGSGGVMLPNHAALVIAEQFAMLEALHPGRIDLGIGRAPGTDPRTAAALRRSADALWPDDFPRDLLDLMGLLGDARTAEGLWRQFSATPMASSSPEIVLLGSSDYSAHLAGLLGLPFAFAHHFDMGGTLDAVSVYRDNFTASEILDEPHVIVTANVLTAPTAEEAEWFAAPGRLMSLAIRTGRPRSVPSPERANADPDLAVALGLPTTRIVGTPDDAVAKLEALAATSGAAELMVSTVTHGLEERLRSLTLLAEAWGRTGDPERPAADTS
jgi:luciferase family oxidoreductase group 1